jgi:small subunit ribosomal protein S21
MIKVKARSGESLEGLLRRFKKMCEKEGLQKEVKRTSFYEKPSDAKRRKTRSAIKKAMQQRLKDAGLLRRKKRKKKRKKQQSAAHLQHQVTL